MPGTRLAASQRATAFSTTCNRARIDDSLLFAPRSGTRSVSCRRQGTAGARLPASTRACSATRRSLSKLSFASPSSQPNQPAPETSLASKSAASPFSMCPLGSCQRLPCWVEINRIVAPRTTRPPAERWCSVSTIAGVAGMVAGGARGLAAGVAPRARFRALSGGGLFAIPAGSPGGESRRIDSHRLEGGRPDPVGIGREDQVAARGGGEPVVAQDLLDELSRAPPGIAQEETEELGRRLGKERQVD